MTACSFRLTSYQLGTSSSLAKSFSYQIFLFGVPGLSFIGLALVMCSSLTNQWPEGGDILIGRVRGT